jgi:hypothetical protein
VVLLVLFLLLNLAQDLDLSDQESMTLDDPLKGVYWDCWMDDGWEVDLSIVFVLVVHLVVVLIINRLGLEKKRFAKIKRWYTYTLLNNMK